MVDLGARSQPRLEWTVNIDEDALPYLSISGAETPGI
jgi:hypothetical protein